MALLPLFVRLSGRSVLVVGAGSVAERKLVELLDAGARVVVVSPEATPAVAELSSTGRVRWERRGFAEEDAVGRYLIVSATGDAAVQRAVFAAGEARSTFVLAIDDPDHGSAYGGAIVRRQPFTIAISSAAEAPALSRLLREIIEKILPEDRWVQAARALRARWKREGTPMGSRFEELVRSFRDEPEK